jgi:pullulanase/glycogen debranching enzyme
MLRSKSLDGNSYNSGDWFNRLDFTYAGNNWGVGLPPNGSDRWPLMAERLADPALRPAPENIQAAVAHFREMLQVRKSTRLFRLPTAEAIAQRLAFYNTGPNQLAGLIVMALDNRGANRIADPFDLVAVLVNANPGPVTFSEAAFTGLALELHPVLAQSADAVVRQAAFEAGSATFTVPGRTTAVFVLEAAGGAPEPAAGLTAGRGPQIVLGAAVVTALLAAAGILAAARRKRS